MESSRIMFDKNGNVILRWLEMRSEETGGIYSVPITVSRNLPLSVLSSITTDKSLESSVNELEKGSPLVLCSIASILCGDLNSPHPTEEKFDRLLAAEVVPHNDGYDLLVTVQISYLLGITIGKIRMSDVREFDGDRNKREKLRETMAQNLCIRRFREEGGGFLG